MKTIRIPVKSCLCRMAQAESPAVDRPAIAFLELPDDQVIKNAFEDEGGFWNLVLTHPGIEDNPLNVLLTLDPHILDLMGPDQSYILSEYLEARRRLGEAYLNRPRV